MVVEYKDAIPLDGLMEAIEHHFEARQRLFQARATLNDRAQQVGGTTADRPTYPMTGRLHDEACLPACRVYVPCGCHGYQFRVVEKRLLVRFKEKNPAPLMGLDAVLQEAYRQVREQEEQRQATAA